MDRTRVSYPIGRCLVIFNCHKPLEEKTLKKEINIERAVWLRSSYLQRSQTAMAPPQLSASASASASTSFYACIPTYVCAPSSARAFSTPRLPMSSLARIRTPFASGSPLLICRSSRLQKPACRATSVSIRCEQSANEGNSLDVWLGRLAMVGFAVAISVEIATGKGLLENFGLTSPLPTVALAVTALVGVLTAVFIFQSASKN